MMNKKLLCAALLAGMGIAQVASAQEFDDRWYLTAGVGMNIQDGDRDTRNAPFGTLGVGKFLSPAWSLDAELNYQNPNKEANQDLNWSQYGISFDVRRHFINEARNWNPYLLFGVQSFICCGSSVVCALATAAHHRRVDSRATGSSRRSCSR